MQVWDAGGILTTTRKAVTKLEVANLPATGWALHPTDWEVNELAAAAQYASNPGQPTPVDRMARRLWGLPVVVSTGITAGIGVLGDFTGSARLYVTEDARVDWSENVSDDFSRNLMRFRCEARVGFGVTRPLAFVNVDLTAA